MTEEKNSEAKFAFPEDNIGIGYYFEGEQVSPEEFGRLVSEKADRILAQRDAARIQAGREAGTGSGKPGSS